MIYHSKKAMRYQHLQQKWLPYYAGFSVLITCRLKAFLTPGYKGRKKGYFCAGTWQTLIKYILMVSHIQFLHPF
jgi:hypothetical protein